MAPGRRLGQRHSLEELEDAIAALLADWWAPVGRHLRRTAVLHVTDTLEAGGAERMAVNLVNGLDRPGSAPSCAPPATRASSPPRPARTSPPCRLGRRRRRDDPAAVLRLAAFLRRHRVDLVHAHGTSLFISAAARLLVPAPDWSGTTTWAPTRHPARPAPPHRLAAGRVDRVIAVSRVLEEWDREVLGFPADRVVTIPYFVVDPPGPLDPGAARHRRPPGGLRGQPRGQKGPPHAARRLGRGGRAGPRRPPPSSAPRSTPPSPPVAEDLARPRPGRPRTLLGARSDVADVLATRDVGVLSSRSRGFPRAARVRQCRARGGRHRGG